MAFDRRRPAVARLALVLAAAAAAVSLSSLPGAVRAQMPNEVVVLTDYDFEHLTQASTGQTTGRWLVLLYNGSEAAVGKASVAAEDAWEQLAMDEEKAVVVAKLDLSAWPRTAKRFAPLLPAGSSAAPAALLLRDRAVYVLDLGALAADADAVVEGVAAFVDGGYEKHDPHKVPAEETLLQALLGGVKAYLDSLPPVHATPMLFAGIGLLAGGLIMFLTFVIAGVWYMQPERPPKPAAAAAGAGKKPSAAAAGASKKDDDAGAGVAAAPAVPLEGDDGDDEGDEDEAEGAGGAKVNKTRAVRRRA